MPLTPALAVDLPRAHDAARRARSAVRTHLRARLPQEVDLAERTLVVVTELVTNAVRHGGGPVRLEVHVRGTTVHVAVCDEGPGRPVRRPASTTAEGGRGIALVDALSADWGVDGLAGGKRVWARLT